MADKSVRERSLVDAALIGSAQVWIWLLAAVGFLTTQVDLHGIFISVPSTIVYLLLCLAAMMLVPLAYLGPVNSVDPGSGSVLRPRNWLGAFSKELTRACTSPCIVLLELAVLSGNITPWVFAEPLLLAGVGNISFFRGHTIASRLESPSAPWMADALPAGRYSTGAIEQSVNVSPTKTPSVLLLERGTSSILVRTNGASPTADAVICVGGVGGGFDSPASGLYSALASSLKKHVQVLDVAFRQPGNLESSIQDLQMAIDYERQLGATHVQLIGHSFGGGVCVSAALLEPSVSSVIALSSQTTGCENVAKLAPRPILLIHGVFDYINPRFCSEDIYRRANQPKSVRFVPATHLLDESSSSVYQLTHNWVTRHCVNPDVRPAL